MPRLVEHLVHPYITAHGQARIGEEIPAAHAVIHREVGL
jgi:hypothetical protein